MKTKSMLTYVLTLVLCVSMLSAIWVSAVDQTDPNLDEEGFSCTMATPDADYGDPNAKVGFDNGEGSLHLNNLLKCAYAKTRAFGWINTTYIYAKVTIGTRSNTKSDRSGKQTISTNRLYAAAGENVARGNHTITSTQNGTQRYSSVQYFS